MRIGHIELFVKNPLASKAFYEDILGFELVANQEGQFIWLKCGDMEILLRQGQGFEPVTTYQASSSAVVLYCDDVETTANRLREKGLVFEGTDGSAECLTFTDPDGHWFQLVNPEHP